MNNYVNHLKDEESPYLKQHSTNPVDWHPWGEEAFELASKLDKPVFLSIGYSTCHWCHVMERESFSDPEVGKVMNETFVCIKVDREERPNVDSFYMSISIAERGSGGWPLNLILTPEKKPVTSYTYLPKESRHGNMGLVELARTIQTLWKTEREALLERADDLVSSMNTSPDRERVKVDPEELSKSAFEALQKGYDNQYGGFGTGIKFPSPHNIIFLLKYYGYYGNEEALRMAEQTLQSMRYGGIFDQVGYGFHRYSTDMEWKVPHFEKMLYDQAWTMMAYAYAFAFTQNEFYRNVVREIYEFIERDLKSPDGGYYTAIDADSEGVEGKYYLWTLKELREILGDNLNDFLELFPATENGNFFQEHDPSSRGYNVLFLAKDYEKSQNKNEFDYQIFWNESDKIKEMLNHLLNERSKRIAPEKDTKVCASTNGMFLSALSISYLATYEPCYYRSARELFSFMKNHFIDASKILRVKYSNGKTIPGYLDDYANVISGIIEFYRITLDETILPEIDKLMKTVIDHFKDDSFLYHDNQGIIPNNVGDANELYDGAIPNPNSVMLRNIGFYSLLNDDLELYMQHLFLEKAFVKNLSNYSSSHTWAITSLLELNKSLVIKIPQEFILTEPVSKINQIKIFEKILKRVNENEFDVCNTTECKYHFETIIKLIEVTEKL